LAHLVGKPARAYIHTFSRQLTPLSSTPKKALAYWHCIGARHSFSLLYSTATLIRHRRRPVECWRASAHLIGKPARAYFLTSAYALLPKRRSRIGTVSAPTTHFVCCTVPQHWFATDGDLSKADNDATGDLQQCNDVTQLTLFAPYHDWQGEPIRVKRCFYIKAIKYRYA
jgi:hypothetical protein